MVLYPLRPVGGSRKPGEFPVGSVYFDGTQVQIDCPDRELRTRLQELFLQPIRVRAARGEQEQVLAHVWETLEPGTEQHFTACVARLHQYGLAPGS
jgi:hypothetical protein